MAAGTLDAMKDRTFTDLHRRILDFERAWGTSGGPKIAAIWGRFDGMSSTRYYQLLDWAIAQPEALEHDAQTVRCGCGRRGPRLAVPGRGWRG